MVYILSEVRLKNDFNDVINLQSSAIQEATRNAQDIYLRSIIGDYLLDTLEDMIENDMLTGDYKILVDEYCIPYLEFRTMAELQMSTFKLNNAGANQVYDSNINTLTLEQVKYLEQQYINKASYYENRMTKYLIQSGIPEYKMNTGITNASTTITEQTGIFLGGTSRTTKTTKRTTTTNNNVGAVRYDTYQKLTDAEKQQARENIGMYNYNDDAQFDSNKYYDKSEINNRFNDYYNKEEVDTIVNNIDIDVDLSNYYTKEEVNDLVSNSGGSDTDLSNYYNKQETETVIQNAISDIDIPTKTSDLTLDNVYTKTETDTVIQNAIGDIDIPTFPTLATVATSGNYNDLTNKPTLFDGNYNSLSNKPTIPTDTTQLTKSDVYSKSEIDSMIGNINNILETI